MICASHPPGAPGPVFGIWDSKQPLRHHLQPNPLVLLKTSNDFEEIGSRRIAPEAEHLMKGLDMDAGLLGQRGKAHRRIDEVAQNLAA